MVLVTVLFVCAVLNTANNMYCVTIMQIQEAVLVLFNKMENFSVSFNSVCHGIRSVILKMKHRLALKHL